MNKQKFLKELEKRLAILSEEERNDTINEYSDIIDEKIKHGKTGEEAVREFGNIDELTKEILAAYKINPEYQNKKNEAGDKAKEFVETTEDFIKKSAKKLSEVTDEVVENFKKSEVEFTTEKVFEIVIKIIIILFALAILKLPFHLIREIGTGIFSIGFPPFSWISSIVWTILIEIIYLAICVFVIYTVVNKYVKTSKKEESKSTQEPKTTKEETKNSDVKKTQVVEYKKEEQKIVKKKENNKDTLGEVLLILVKIWVSIIMLIPLWLINFGLIICIVVAIYLIIKGVAIYGILLLVVGLSILCGEVCTIIYRLLFSKKRIYPYTFIIGTIVVIIGSVMTFDYFDNLKYYNDLPENKYQTEKYIEEVVINNSINIQNNKQIIIDNNMENNKIKVVIDYYKDILKIEKEQHNNEYIYYEKEYNRNEFNIDKQIREKFINSLKENKIYDYSKLDHIEVKVYVNESTVHLVS